MSIPIFTEAERALNTKEKTVGQVLSNALKRTFDIICSVLGLILLSPLFIILSILIKRDSPGPIFYKSRRVGKDGREFDMLKFRTMREEPASYNGPRVTAEDDTRITSVGAWLRKTKLNELPQLWNVLIGQMSMVGPRPEDPDIVATWPEEARQIILSIRPGITSPASIVYRNEEKLLNGDHALEKYLQSIAPDKLRLDELYVLNHGFFSDLDILFWTAIKLLPTMDPNNIPENWLFVGPISRFLHRYLVWFGVDFIVSLISIAIIGLIVRSITVLNLGWLRSLGIALVIALLFSFVNALLGMGQVFWKKAPGYYLFDLAFSTFVTTAIVYFINLNFPGGSLLPPRMIISFGALSLFGFATVRYRTRLITGLASRWLRLRGKASKIGERILVVGAGQCGIIACLLVERSELNELYSIVGIVDDDPKLQGMRVNGYPVLGPTSQIKKLVEEKNIGVIMFAISRINQRNKSQILKLCNESGAKVVIIPDILRHLEEELKRPPTEVHEQSLAE
ncbi:MAG: sugar transferase [Anaerolineaceae bacterium]|nr:sugar transferase [Anaerolineaceae bacterium]